MRNITFKKLNNSGKQQKIRCIMIDGCDKYEPCVVIRVRVLINASDCIDYKKTGYTIIKGFNDLRLVENEISLQIKTLGLINSLVFSEVLEELRVSSVKAC